MSSANINNTMQIDSINRTDNNIDRNNNDCNANNSGLDKNDEVIEIKTIPIPTTSINSRKSANKFHNNTSKDNNITNGYYNNINKSNKKSHNNNIAVNSSYCKARRIVYSIGD